MNLKGSLRKQEGFLFGTKMTRRFIQSLSESTNSKRLQTVVLLCLAFSCWGFVLQRSASALVPQTIKKTPNEQDDANPLVEDAVRVSGQPELSAAEEKILEDRAELDATTFAEEKAAQAHGRTITQLWDRLRDDPTKFASVASDYLPKTLFVSEEFNFDEKINTTFGEIGHHRQRSAESVSLSQESLSNYFFKFQQQGWRLEESEFHHLAFDSATKEAPATSTVNLTLHVRNGHQKVIIRGKAQLTWLADNEDQPKLDVLDASQLEAWHRSGPTPFRQVMGFSSSSIDRKRKGRLHPLLVQDFNGDGRPDIGLGGCNLLLRNEGKGRFEPSNLIQSGDTLSSGVAVGDFDGDGRVDLVAATHGVKSRELQFYAGLPKANFAAGKPLFAEGRVCLKEKVNVPQSATVADIDGDGDLDIFLGQYIGPYQGGNMPQPFYDANDCFPSFLLVNDGKGNFTDETDQRGLKHRRNRRVYGTSFVDIDNDGNLDLVVTSDFAGIDVFRGDGTGNFVDKSKDWVAQPRLFGMSHALADFNRDGRLDLFAVGMASTTARRLERMQAGVEDEKDITAHRASMGHGNRMYFGSKIGGSFTLTEPALAEDVAESGWSWAAADGDLDNNGLRDLYICNGHMSGKSASDYCSTFWKHDIYTNVRREKGQNWNKLFKSQLCTLGNFETSWNGYEHNVAFMQIADGQFENLSYLMGISNEADSRASIAVDVDLDGDLDLITTIVEKTSDLRHTLVVFENLLKTGAETGWIGVDFGGINADPSPLNARIKLTRLDGSTEIKSITSGASYACQYPTSCHFGLGDDDSIRSVEILWANGSRKVIKTPEINRWHKVAAQTQ